MKKGESSRPESLGDHGSLRPTAELLREQFGTAGHAAHDFSDRLAAMVTNLLRAPLLVTTKL